MRIGPVDTDARVLVVAEAGNNHEGDFGLAMRLIDAAADCGADAVKFQTARAELFISPLDAARLARFRSYEFSPPQWAALSRHARARGLLFLSTALDLESAAMLTPVIDAFKIASGDITFTPLLQRLAASRVPLILSTGASDEATVARAVDTVTGAWRTLGHDGALALLQCESAYPAPPEEANLRGIAWLAARFGLTTGYSDHVLGTEAAVAAVAAGARIVEKHLTIDKAQSSFRDHQLSADPDEFCGMVRRIREIERLLGVNGKTVRPAEADTAAIRRSIATLRALPPGHVLRFEDLVWLRPATGFAPGDEARVVGRRLAHALSAGTILADRDLE
jgi:N,N'-diacetyllegionaminate synthase